MWWRNLQFAVLRFLARREEEKGEKERSNSSISREKDDVAEEEVKEENETAECEGEFSQIFEVVRGAELLTVRP